MIRILKAHNNTDSTDPDPKHCFPNGVPYGSLHGKHGNYLLFTTVVGEALPQGLSEQAARGDGVLAGNVRAVYLREGGEAGSAQGICAHHNSIGFESPTVKHLSVPLMFFTCSARFTLSGLKLTSLPEWYGTVLFK